MGSYAQPHYLAQKWSIVSSDHSGFFQMEINRKNKFPIHQCAFFSLDLPELSQACFLIGLSSTPNQNLTSSWIAAKVDLYLSFQVISVVFKRTWNIQVESYVIRERLLQSTSLSKARFWSPNVCRRYFGEISDQFFEFFLWLHCPTLFLCFQIVMWLIPTFYAKVASLMAFFWLLCITLVMLLSSRLLKIRVHLVTLFVPYGYSLRI